MPKSYVFGLIELFDNQSIREKHSRGVGIKLCAYSVGKEILSCDIMAISVVLEDRANQAKILVYFLFVI